MMSITLKVRNFLGVSRADVELKGIVLVGGLNGAGKSSLLDAAACAALQDGSTRGQNSKKAAAALLKEGSEAGSVTLEYDGGAVRIVYPGCDIDQSGKPPALGTELGIGAERYAALRPTERAAQIIERWKASPDRSDLANWLAAHKPEAEPVFPTKELADLWGRIEASGWDAVHKAAAEHATKLKGQWEQISGRKFGVAVVKKWVPAPLLEGEEYDLGAEQEAAAEAKTALEQLLQHAAVDASRIAGWEEQVGDLPVLHGKLRGLIENAAVLSEQADRLNLERARHADIGEGPNYLKCPGCGVTVKLVHEGRRESLQAITAHATPSEVQAAIDTLKRIDGDRAAVLKKLSDNSAEQGKVRAEIAACERSKEALEKARAAGGSVGQPEIDKARERSLVLDQKVAAVQKLRAGRKIVNAFDRHTLVVEALSTDGVRKSVLDRKLAEINAELADLSALAKFAPVSLAPDLSPLFDGRAYALCSESEKWRVDLALTLLFNQREKASFVLIDRLDMLNNQARPGVFLALRKLDIPALIACTAKDKGALPDLEAAKIGSVRWLTAGTLEEGAK